MSLLILYISSLTYFHYFSIQFWLQFFFFFILLTSYLQLPHSTSNEMPRRRKKVKKENKKKPRRGLPELIPSLFRLQRCCSFHIQIDNFIFHTCLLATSFHIEINNGRRSTVWSRHFAFDIKSNKLVVLLHSDVTHYSPPINTINI